MAIQHMKGSTSTFDGPTTMNRCPAKDAIFIPFILFGLSRILDDRLLNVVLVLVLTTSILGPVLTERFAPLMMRSEGEEAPAQKAA
jgi:hypothetical protein